MTIEKKYEHPEIEWYDRLNPLFWFKNIDEPWPPEHYASKIAGWPNWKVHLWWWFRNPFHNFNYYTIGVAGRDIEIKGRYISMFAPSGWNWLIVKYKWIRLPYFSYLDGETKIYLGWGDSGQFGIEIKGKSWKSFLAWIIIGLFFYLLFVLIRYLLF